MLFSLLILKIFVLRSLEAVTPARQYTAEIAPHAMTSWGVWGPEQFCPESSYVHGYQLRVELDCFKHDGEHLRDCDDTALNAIRLFCAYHFDGMPDDLEAGYVESSSGPFGAWAEPIYCPGNGVFATGAQFRSEPDQGGSDDTAGNNLNMECTDGTILEGRGDPWGEWSSWVVCPKGTAVCGLKNLVEGDCYKHDGHDVKDCDDTAHNAVIFYCCDLPQ